MKKTLFFLGLTCLMSIGHAQYCVPGADCSDEDVIYAVQFGDSLFNESECGTDGYTDYTNSVAPAEAVAGETYTLTVLVGSGWYERVSAWIDYNNDGSFDDDEYLGEIGDGGYGVETSSEVTIPSDLAGGNYRLRIAVYAAGLGGDPMTDPCYNDLSDYGEFEDYLVNVTPALGIGSNQANALAVYPNPVKDIFHLNLPSNVNSSALKVTVTDLAGKTVKTFTKSNEYNVQDLPSGVYVISVNDGTSIKTQKLIKK